MVMDRSEKAHKDFGEASSDGEEDFESADEGEGEKKAVGKTKQEKYYKSKDKETGYEKPKECIRENNQASSKNYDGALSVISDQSGSEGDKRSPVSLEESLDIHTTPDQAVQQDELKENSDVKGLQSVTPNIVTRHAENVDIKTYVFVDISFKTLELNISPNFGHTNPLQPPPPPSNLQPPPSKPFPPISPFQPPSNLPFPTPYLQPYLTLPTHLPTYPDPHIPNPLPSNLPLQPPEKHFESYISFCRKIRGTSHCIGGHWTTCI